MDLPSIIETVLPVLFPPETASSPLSFTEPRRPRKLLILCGEDFTTGDADDIEGLKEKMDEAGIDRCGGGFGGSSGGDSVLEDLMSEPDDVC